MKNILFLLAFIPTLAFSQVSSWRTNPPQQRVETPRVQTPSVQGQRSDVSMWRTNPPRDYRLPDPRGRVRIQNWGRPNQFGYYWGNWGWYQPIPFIWYDDFGWRQRSVIHVYENGRRDTIRKESNYYSFGIGQTNNRQVRPILEKLFELIPDAYVASQSDKSSISAIIKTTGFQNVKAEKIIKLSKKWIDGFNDVIDLPGIGKYGKDSWEIFINKNHSVIPTDKKLLAYLSQIK